MQEYVFLNGKFLKKQNAKISAFDHGFLYGDGVYETLLVLKGILMDSESHLKRLHRSCSVLGLSLPQYMDSDTKILEVAQELIARNVIERGRLRITISRGENNFDFSSCPNPTILISVSPLGYSSENFFSHGVSIKTLPFERSYPAVKSINFLASLLGRREISDTDAYEGVFVTGDSHRFFREGTVSNIIALNAQKKVFWVAPEKTVLAGTMQKKISEKLYQSGFKKISRNFSLDDICNEKMEVIITNSLFGAIPVHTIDDTILDTEFSGFSQYIGKNFLDTIT